MGANKQYLLSFEDGQLTRAEKRELAKRGNAVLRELDAHADAVGTVKAERFPAKTPNVPSEPGKYWAPFRVKQPTHKATSLDIAGIYPFLADPALEPLGPLLGVDYFSGAEFCFDPWAWYTAKRIQSPNLLIIGGIGQGKSHFTKSFVTRELLFGRQAIVVSDSKGEWSNLTTALGGDVIRVGTGAARLNPLDRGPRALEASDVEHEEVVAARRRSTLIGICDALMGAEATTAAEHSALEWVLGQEIIETDDRPTIRGLYQRLWNLDTEAPGFYADLVEDSKRIKHVLRELVEGHLAGMFDGESTVQLDVTAPITNIDTSAMFTRGRLALTITQIVTNAWVQSVIADKKSGRKFFLVNEEGWREMTSLAALEAKREQIKLSREYGISFLFILHKVADFDAVGAEGSAERALAYAMLGDFENKVIFRQERGQLRKTINTLGISPEEANIIRDLERGTSLIRLKDKAYLVDGTATSTTFERALFHTDESMTTAAPAVVAPVAISKPALVFVSCSGCGAHDQPDSFCTQCGKALRVCDACGAAGQAGTFCASCGSNLILEEAAL